MRRGQRAGVAPEFLINTGRVLVTARFAAQITGRPLRTVQDRADPVACHIATGALYWDGKLLGIELDALIPRPRRASVGRKGPVGHATESSRTAT